MLPAVLACATKVVALSTSVMVNAPLVLRTASVSVNAPLMSPPITAASLVPVMVTVTVCWVPSALTAVKLSVYSVPASNWSCAEPMV